jgi:hypothetical protein
MVFASVSAHGELRSDTGEREISRKAFGQS